ncbi:MAG TPA: hypothetical protein VNE40_01630 [Candidatus Dormibacteraeota bacterium]|nr:hypothetical protein [Candidatus Dormibacteraeota bacterium]
MTATNHALTGALIGLTIANPLIALPLALISHFGLDALPHFGKQPNNATWLRSPIFKTILTVDILLCLALVAVLYGLRPDHWFLAASCAFLGTSPDLLSIGRFRNALAHRKLTKPSGLALFASAIQWFERPIGIVVEAAWLLAMLLLLQPFFR